MIEIGDDDFVADWDTPEWRARNVEINRLLPEHIPELRDAYRAAVVDPQGVDEDDGPHTVYSEVFYDFLEHALRTEPEGSPLLDRIYAFLRLLDERDAQYGHLATVGVCEFLEDHKIALRRARPHLGPNMTAFLDRPRRQGP